MKHFLSLLLFIQFICTNAQEEIVNIPDANFKQCLLENTDININGDGESIGKLTFKNSRKWQ